MSILSQYDRINIFYLFFSLRHGAEALARAKYNVCRYYDSVGITEDMRSFVEVLEHLYPSLMSGIVNVYDETG